jgi:hypothetical protein
MRTPRWPSLLLALVALGGSGCPDPGECFNTSTPQPPNRQLLQAGKEAFIDVSVGFTTQCQDVDGPSQVPESVTVEVHGPENQPIPATAELFPSGMLARVRFTPPVTGRYHVLVAFAPVGSLQQFSVFVVEDRRQETPMARFGWASTCPYVDRTLQGTWLCGAMAVREPQGTSQSLANSAEQVVVAGDVVWVVEGSRVVRYVDTGTGPLVATGTAPYPPPGGPSGPALHARLATGDELLVATDPHLYRYTFSAEGGLRSAPATQWGQQFSPGMGADMAAALLVRAGDRVLVVHRVQDTTTFEVRTQACPFRASTATGPYAPVQGQPCQRLAGEVVGFEDGGVWTRSQAFSTNGSEETLRRYAAVNGQLVEDGVLALDGQLLVNMGPLRPGAILPSLFSSFGGGPYAGPRWSPEKRTMELELTPMLGSFGPARLGQRYYWVDSIQGGSVVVFPRQRPSSP